MRTSRSRTISRLGSRRHFSIDKVVFNLSGKVAIVSQQHHTSIGHGARRRLLASAGHHVSPTGRRGRRCSGDVVRISVRSRTTSWATRPWRSPTIRPLAH